MGDADNDDMVGDKSWKLGRDGGKYVWRGDEDGATSEYAYIQLRINVYLDWGTLGSANVK